MKYFVTTLMIALTFCLNHVFGQSNQLYNDLEDTTKVRVLPLPAPLADTTSSKIYEFVEKAPTFPGGDAGMIAFIQANLRYPENSIENNEQGKVYVYFIIESDGSISNITIARGVSPSIDAEAIRVIKLMPKWNPGLEKGRPVRTRMMLPVVFKLQ
jgi:protein TonB